MPGSAILKVKAEVLEVDHDAGRAVVAMTIGRETSLLVFEIDDEGNVRRVDDR